MTSTQGNKQNNHLDKPSYYLIKPNECTLDIIPSSLFFVGIWTHKYQLIIFCRAVLAWKIPYDTYYVSWQLHLESRGMVEDIFQNKGRSKLFRIPRKGVPFMLHPEIKYFNTWEMYESDCDKVKFQFTINMFIGCNVPKAFVTMNPLNSFEANIHKNIVGSVGVPILVINAWCE